MSPQEIAQVVNVVDQIEKDRAGSGLAPPVDVEIIVRLEQPEHRTGYENSAKLAAVDDLFGLLDHRIVAAMMADQKGHTSGLRGADQLFTGRNIVCNRLFDQRRHSGGNGFETVGDMDLVGRRDDDAVGTIRLDHCRKAWEPFCAGLPRDLLPERCRIDDGQKFRLRLGKYVLDMSSADQPGAEHRKPCFPFHASLYRHFFSPAFIRVATRRIAR